MWDFGQDLRIHENILRGRGWGGVTSFGARAGLQIVVFISDGLSGPGYEGN